MATRYVAEWVAREVVAADGSHGEFEDARREFKSANAAMRCAMREGRKAGVCPWTKVRAQVAVSYRDSVGPGTRWETVTTWQGDWDGLDEV